MKNFRKSRKALSPVVASIILIAVTVAVSIAVAAWMGALTVGFMGSSSVTITNVNFAGTSGAADNTIVLTLKNTGTKSVTISQVKVNTAIKSFNLDHPRAERAVAQRQLVLPHEVLRFLPFAAVHVKQHDAVYGMVFLKHRLDSRQLWVGQYVFYLLFFSTFL